MDDIFLDAGFEETITYTPDGGVASSITAVVDRGGAKDVEIRVRGFSRSNARRYDMEIWISTSDVATVKVNADKVTLLARIGDTVPKTYVVKGIVDNDAGCWHLELAN